MSQLPYTLVRSRRKTLALVVDGDGTLIVRAPLRMSKATIHAFIDQKSAWIADKQQLARDACAAHRAITLQDGESLLVFGEPHTILSRDVPEVVVTSTHLLVPTAMTLEAFAKWLKTQGEALIRDRVDWYARRMGVQYAGVKMSSARRRWGSCGAANTLNFAWRLAMCPPFVIDYVVVHELSHIVQKNHGPDFWALVAAILPDYRQAVQWLKRHRKLLDVL